MTTLLFGAMLAGVVGLLMGVVVGPLWGVAGWLVGLAVVIGWMAWNELRMHRKDR